MLKWLSGNSQGEPVSEESRKRKRSHTNRGLEQVYPPLDSQGAETTTIEIIAINGLDTSAPATWEYRLEEGGVVNWLSDAHMLPQAIPHARIMTYNWDAAFSRDASKRGLGDHADTFLLNVRSFRQEKGEPNDRPLLFIASCYGGLLLMKAFTIASSKGGEKSNPFFRDSTIGIVFLGTPFKGTSVHKAAQWIVAYQNLKGEEASDILIQHLDPATDFLGELTKQFFKDARVKNYNLQLFCLYETDKTNLTTKLLSRSLAKSVESLSSTYLVEKNSAYPLSCEGAALNGQHIMMNKFAPEMNNFRTTKSVIQDFVSKADETLKGRRLATSPQTEHPHWNHLPFARNHKFVGRKSILDELHKKIPPSVCRDDCQRTVIHGLGGIGKTQIALKATYRIQDDFPGCSIFWVSAINAAVFRQDCRDIGIKLAILAVDEKSADVESLVKTALEKIPTGWLLIIDNVDDPKLVLQNKQHFSNWLPFSHKGSILITTRSRDIAITYATLHHRFEISGMDDEESIELLKQNLSEDQHDKKSIKQLIELLCGLPLAVRQANAFLTMTQRSTERYLEYCQKSEKTIIKLLREGSEDEARDEASLRSIFTTWSVSFDQISHQNLYAAFLLKSMSYFAAKDIPASLLPLPGLARVLGRSYDSEDDYVIEVKTQLDKALGILKSYAFVTGKEDQDTCIYDMHRLVQLATLNWLRQEDEFKWFSSIISEHMSDKLKRAIDCNRHDFIKYLPHAITVLERSNDYPNKHSAFICYGVARGHYSLGDSRNAQHFLRRAYSFDGKKVWNRLLRVNSTILLGRILRDQIDRVKSEQKMKRALQLCTQHLGAKHEQAQYQEYAVLSSRLSENGAAKQMCGRTVEMARTALGDEHVDTLSDPNRYAVVLGSLERFNETMARTIFKTTERYFGVNRPQTLRSMLSLAINLSARDKDEEATQILQEVIERNNNSTGDERDMELTLQSTGKLGKILKKTGKFAEAETVLASLLDLANNLWGENHPHTLSFSTLYGTVLVQLHRFDEAAMVLRQSAERQAEHLGREHPGTLIYKIHLAAALQHLGNHDKVGKMYQDISKIIRNFVSIFQDYRQNLGGVEKTCQDTSQIIKNLTLTIQDHLGKHEGDNRFYQDISQIMRNVASIMQDNQEEHEDDEEFYQDISEILRNAASIMQDYQGEHRDDEKLYQDISEIMRNVASIIQVDLE